MCCLAQHQQACPDFSVQPEKSRLPSTPCVKLRGSAQCRFVPGMALSAEPGFSLAQGKRSRLVNDTQCQGPAGLGPGLGGFGAGVGARGTAAVIQPVDASDGAVEVGDHRDWPHVLRVVSD